MPQKSTTAKMTPVPASGKIGMSDLNCATRAAKNSSQTNYKSGYEWNSKNSLLDLSWYLCTRGHNYGSGFNQGHGNTEFMAMDPDAAARGIWRVDNKRQGAEAGRAKVRMSGFRGMGMVAMYFRMKARTNINGYNDHAAKDGAVAFRGLGMNNRGTYSSGDAVWDFHIDGYARNNIESTGSAVGNSVTGLGIDYTNSGAHSFSMHRCWIRYLPQNGSTYITPNGSMVSNSTSVSDLTNSSSSSDIYGTRGNYPNMSYQSNVISSQGVEKIIDYKSSLPSSGYFSGSTSKWYSGYSTSNRAGWVWRAGSAVAIGQLRIHRGNDHASRDPRVVAIYGSNSTWSTNPKNMSWTYLGTVNFSAGTSSNRLHVETQTIPSYSGAYSAYYFEVERNQYSYGTGGHNEFQLTEIEILPATHPHAGTFQDFTVLLSSRYGWGPQVSHGHWYHYYDSNGSNFFKYYGVWKVEHGTTYNDQQSGGDGRCTSGGYWSYSVNDRYPYGGKSYRLAPVADFRFGSGAHTIRISANYTARVQIPDLGFDKTVTANHNSYTDYSISISDWDARYQLLVIDVTNDGSTSSRNFAGVSVAIWKSGTSSAAYSPTTWGGSAEEEKLVWSTARIGGKYNRNTYKAWYGGTSYGWTGYNGLPADWSDQVWIWPGHMEYATTAVNLPVNDLTNSSSSSDIYGTRGNYPNMSYQSNVISSQGVEKIIDYKGNLPSSGYFSSSTSKWYSGYSTSNRAGWVWRAGSAVSITQLRIHRGNDHASRDPRIIRVYGSNSTWSTNPKNMSWTYLGSVNYSAGTSSNRLHVETQTIPSYSGVYSAYYFEVERNQYSYGTGGHNEFQLTEIEILGASSSQQMLSQHFTKHAFRTYAVNEVQ